MPGLTRRRPLADHRRVAPPPSAVRPRLPSGRGRRRQRERAVADGREQALPSTRPRPSRRRCDAAHPATMVWAKSRRGPRTSKLRLLTQNDDRPATHIHERLNPAHATGRRRFTSGTMNDLFPSWACTRACSARRTLRRFHQRFGERRMRVNRQLQVFRRRAHLDRQHAFRNQFTGA